MLLIVLASIAGVWLLLSVLYLALCRVAAANERREPSAPAPASREIPHEISPTLASGLVIWEDRRQPAADAQRPRRARTWSAVRSKIFTSLHRDQFATYR